MIIHLVSAVDWRRRPAGRKYQPDSLETEGFVHCCDPAQVEDVMATWYPGRSDLLALVIDPKRLRAPLVREDLYGHGEFPHIYGPINRSAIAAVRRVSDLGTKQGSRSDRAQPD